MVDLPQIPRRITTIDAPRSPLTGAEISAPFSRLAGDLTTIGETLEQTSVDLAEKAGRDAVRKDDNGNLVVDRSPLPIIGKAAGEFARTAKLTYLARSTPDIENAALKMRLENPNNPEAFKQAGDSFTDQLVSNAERAGGTELGLAVRRVAEREVGQQYRTTLVEADKLTTANALEVYKSQLSSLDNKAAALARQGGTDTEEYRQIIGDISGVYKELQGNARFKYPPARALEEQNEMTSRHKGEAVIGQAIQLFTKKDAPTARKFLQEAAWDPGLNLSPAKRAEIVTRGVAALDGLTAENKAAVDANKMIVRETIEGLKSDAPYDSRTFNDLVDRTVGLGDVESYYKLTTYRAFHEWRQTIKELPIGQQVEALSELRKSSPRIAPQETTARAKTAMDFFQSRGWTKEQAAGIVGNLIHESNLDSSASHDAGTGIGIAGHRLERRTELRKFAAARGKTETDFQTQLEFIDRELNSSESGAGNQLRSARTPEEAARAFISFERPLGWSENRPEAGHGFANRRGLAVAVYGDKPLALPATTGGLWTEAVRGEMTNDFRRYLSGKADGLVATLESALKAGRQPGDGEIRDVAAIIRETGRGDLTPRVEVALEGFDAATGITALPTSTRSAFRGALQTQAAAGVDPIQRKVIDVAEETVARTEKAMKDTPYTVAAQRFRTTEPYALNFDNPGALAAAVTQRSGIQGVIRNADGTGPISIFERDENEAFRGALTRADAKGIAGMFSALGRLPDDQLEATLNDKTIQDGIRGMIRTTDPAKFNAAMSSLDAVYGRMPQDFVKMFGADTLHALKTWQANTRYFTPEQLAEERRRAEDPQVRARREANIHEGEKLATKMEPADVVKQFDTSWWLTPGFVARATGSQPLPPVDAGTRDALMGDFTTIAARRYAETLDWDTAQKQASEILKTKWARSEINGGRLMLRAPETVYPAVNGSHDWLRSQIETDLSQRLGTRDEVRKGGPSGNRDAGLTGRRNWDYSLVSDRQTETEALSGKPPSYVVMVRDNKKTTPQWDVLKGDDGRIQRYAWDAGPAVQKSREDFASQRQRVIGGDPLFWTDPRGFGGR